MTPTSTPDPRRWWTLGAVALSLLVLSIDNTILNVALPTIERDLHATTSGLQWIVDAYLVVFAGLLLTMGALGDRIGRKKILLSGLTVFGLASASAALANSAGMLITARGIMGLAGAAIMPATLSIITNVFPREEQPKAIGLWAGVFGIGIALGPTTGGALLQAFDGWSAVFLVNVPIVLVAITAGIKLVPESRDPAPDPVDIPGALLSTAGLTTLVYAVIRAPSTGWLTGETIGIGAGGVALLALFLVWQRRAAHPMIDLKLFAEPRFGAASAALTLGSFSLFGSIFFLTQHLQGVLGYDSFEAGLRLLPVAGGLMVAAPMSARVASRVGTRTTVAAGMTAVAVGLLMMLFADAESGYAPVALAQLAIAVGMGTAMAPATTSIMSALPPARAGVGSAMNDAVRMVGGALGVAVLGSLLASGYRAGMVGAPPATRDSLQAALATGNDALATRAVDAFVDGMHAAAAGGAAAALAAAAVAFAFLPRRALHPRSAQAAAEAATA